MRYKRFDVVELNNVNRATILDVENNRYNVEIVNPYGITIDKKYITNTEIKQLIHSSKITRFTPSSVASSISILVRIPSVTTSMRVSLETLVSKRIR